MSTQARQGLTGALLCAGQPKIRVLIADDHAVFRDGLAAIINRQADMEVVAEAQHGSEAFALWKRHRPDVTLLDLRMPELDGIAALKLIRAQDASANVIVLTTYDTAEDIFKGMQAGARGYLLKDVSRQELVNCVRKVQAGEVCVQPWIATKLAERLGSEELTGRETEVLMLLARGKTNKEIGSVLCISETTVKWHVKSIFAKLKVLNRTEAIAAASHRGLIHH